MPVQRDAGWQLDGGRVDLPVVNQDFIMQVRSRGASRGADITDYFALFYAVAVMKSRPEALHMGIGGLEAVIMTDANIIAIGAVGADFFDNAVAGSIDRSSA